MRAQTAARRLAGVFPIGFTPVNAQNQVDFDGLAAQVQFCRRGGVHGLAWPQIASGWTTLTEEERMHGAETIISAARGGNTAIVIGVQSRTADFKETERYARQAEKLGADAIICIAPPGVTAPSELLVFYQRLGKVTSLPLFAQTGGDFSVDLVVEMFHSIPTFRYVKDEAGILCAGDRNQKTDQRPTQLLFGQGSYHHDHRDGAGFRWPLPLREPCRSLRLRL